jgi:hypothetical protein
MLLYVILHLISFPVYGRIISVEAVQQKADEENSWRNYFEADAGILLSDPERN